MRKIIEIAWVVLGVVSFVALSGMLLLIEVAK